MTHKAYTGRIQAKSTFIGAVVRAYRYIERGGVTLGDAELPWHAVAEVSATDDGMLSLGEHTIDCRGHEPSHLSWMVAYLRAKASRLADSEAERDAFVDTARRLSAATSSEPRFKRD